MRIRPLSFIAAALVVALVLLVLLVRGEARPRPGSSIDCSSCDEWNRPREPFKIFGNTYCVGVAGLSSVLVASSAGLVVLDGALPQSAPLIAANIRKLGFRIEDVKLIVTQPARPARGRSRTAIRRETILNFARVTIPRCVSRASPASRSCATARRSPSGT